MHNLVTFYYYRHYYYRHEC